MNKELEVGDIVRLHPDHEWSASDANPVGIDGVVVNVQFYIDVEWDNGTWNAYLPHHSDLIKQERK